MTPVKVKAASRAALRAGVLAPPSNLHKKSSAVSPGSWGDNPPSLPRRRLVWCGQRSTQNEGQSGNQLRDCVLVFRDVEQPTHAPPQKCVVGSRWQRPQEVCRSGCFTMQQEHPSGLEVGDRRNSFQERSVFRSPHPEPQLNTHFCCPLSLSSDGQVNFPFKDLLKILSVTQRMHNVWISIFPRDCEQKALSQQILYPTLPQFPEN